MRRAAARGSWPAAVLLCSLLLASLVGAKEKKKKKPKKKKALKNTDLLCSACEVMVEQVEFKLQSASGKRDEVAITEAMDGLCDSLTMFAYSKDYPRRFIHSTGHHMEADDPAGMSHPSSPTGDSGANPIKVVKADVMHDRNADAKLQKYCAQYVETERYEDQMVAAIRAAKPGETVTSSFCYAQHKECAQRDTEGGQLVAPVLSKHKKVEEFLRVETGAGRETWAAKAIYFPEPAADEDAEPGQTEQWVMAAANAQKHVRFAIVREGALAAQLGYPVPSLQLFRMLGDKDNVTYPSLGQLDGVQTLLEWVQVTSFPFLGTLWETEALAMSESYGTGKIYPQVILFAEINNPKHDEIVENFHGAIEELEQREGGRTIVPALVDIGRKTRKEYEADVAERYQVKRREGAQVRGFRRDVQTQTFGNRLQGMPPGTCVCTSPAPHASTNKHSTSR